MPTRASYNFSRPRHWQTERPDPARPPDFRLHASTPSWRQPRPASLVAPASLRAGFGALGPADGAGRPGVGANAHGARNAVACRRRSRRGRPEQSPHPAGRRRRAAGPGPAGPGLGNAGHIAKIGAVSAGRALVADQPGTKTPLADAGGQLPAFVA